MQALSTSQVPIDFKIGGLRPAVDFRFLPSTNGSQLSIEIFNQQLCGCLHSTQLLTAQGRYTRTGLFVGTFIALAPPPRRRSLPLVEEAERAKQMAEEAKRISSILRVAEDEAERIRQQHVVDEEAEPISRQVAAEEGAVRINHVADEEEAKRIRRRVADEEEAKRIIRQVPQDEVRAIIILI